MMNMRWKRYRACIMNMVQINAVILTLLLGCIAGSCENQDNDNAQTVTLTLQFRINEVNTRSISSTAENTLNTAQLKVLVFKVEDGIETFAYEAPQVTEQANGYSVTLRKSTVGETYRLVIIANAGTLPVISVGTSKNEALKQIVFSCQDKWKTDSDTDYTPIPMWGETANTMTITDDSSLGTITLLRALARIDVGLSLNGEIASGLSNFTLETVSVYRTRDKGYVVPVNATSITDDVVSSVSIPTDAGRNGALTYTSSDGKSLLSSIYVAETEQGTSNSDQVCLVIGGLFNGTLYYYRVDLSNDDGYVPLKRNCRYIVNITAVNAIGYNTEAEALTGNKTLSYGTSISASGWGSETNTGSGGISL